MKTYKDLQEAINRSDIESFILDTINEHKSSDLYKEAEIAKAYMRKRNVTILEYQKLLYTIAGQAVPDNFSANYKFRNAFFPIFVNQEVSYLLGNGVTFNEDTTKNKLGENGMFDNKLVELAKYALWGGVSFGFMNLNKVDAFSVLEFAPIWDDENGSLRAGIRFWQIDETKPLRATLYEEDGYTEWIWSDDKKGEIIREKTPYKLIVASSQIDGLEIIDGQNYPTFPIVPLWGNEEHQSEFTGLREKIDGYDLIQSGFANDLDDASQIYWTITNAGGMDDIDLVKFVERMKTVKAAVVDEAGGSRAEAHTIDVPYNAREAMLQDLRDSLYRDAMALDTDKVSAGSVTATAIETAYQNLDLKCDGFEKCVTTFINDLLELIGVVDSPSYKRNRVINQQEETNMVLATAQYLDDETILKHIPWISPDEIESILQKKTEEEASRYAQLEEEYNKLVEEQAQEEQ